MYAHTAAFNTLERDSGQSPEPAPYTTQQDAPAHIIR